MLKLFYVAYFVVVGVSTPFFPAYLRRVGLSGQAVSAVLMVAPALQLGVPLLWGWLADRTRRPGTVLGILCAGAFLASLPLIVTRTMPTIALLYVAQQLFAGSITALADSIAVEKARAGQHDYARTRLWGSLSFVATCLAMGALLDARRVPDGDPLVPALVSVGFALSFLASLRLRGNTHYEPPRLGDVRRLLRDGRFRLLLFMAGTHWMALVPYHGYFGILLQDRGLPSTVTGQAFMVGACAEIAVFFCHRQLRARIGLLPAFSAAFAVTALRWWLFAYTHSALLIVATQVLHAMTFGMFWATCMAWIGECVPSNVRATGQVLFSATLGMGSVVGLVATGRAYDAVGGAGAAFTAAGILELVPLAAALLYWKRGRSSAQRSVPATDG